LLDRVDEALIPQPGRTGRLSHRRKSPIKIRDGAIAYSASLHLAWGKIC
jgi:hypothetical protein